MNFLFLILPILVCTFFFTKNRKSQYVIVKQIKYVLGLMFCHFCFGQTLLSEVATALYLDYILLHTTTASTSQNFSAFFSKIFQNQLLSLTVSESALSCKCIPLVSDGIQ